MGDLGSKLVARMNCDTVFTIPIFGGVGISESVVITWIVMAFMVILSICLTRNFHVDQISKRQAAVESAYTGLTGFIRDIVGENGKRYVPYLTTLILFLGISNLIGLVGLKPPAKDLNVTVALALMSIILVQLAGIRQKGLKGWLKSFAEPSALITPLNIMDVLTRPLSLCMRLFGNILGGFVIMELIYAVAPIIVPIPLSLYFDIFDGLMQAYIFVFLTSLFIREAVE